MGWRGKSGVGCSVDRPTEALEMAIGDHIGSTEIAGAKINLALHVGGRRADGYHVIESLVVFADYGDFVRATPSTNGRVGLTVKGPFAGALARLTPPRDNLANRAAEALVRAIGRRPTATRLALTKRLPVAAGLGGGSADAAATLRLLDRIWNLKLGQKTLAEIGLELGADVPMCLDSRPLVAKGIGERIEPVAGIPRLPIVLAHPPVALPTASAFAALGHAERSPPPPLPGKLDSPIELIFWLRQTRNDLIAAAVTVTKLAGAAAEALANDHDCLFARMSGSGPAAFGIFASRAAADRAAERLRTAKPDWWVVSALTGASSARGGEFRQPHSPPAV